MDLLFTDHELERFMNFVEPEPNTGCWLWTGAVDGPRRAYPVFSFRRTSKQSFSKAYRLSFRNWVAEIPEGYEIDHKCKVTFCVNPAHLEAVTPRENRLRASIKCSHNNWHIRPNGRRRCKTCDDAWHKNYRKKKLEAHNSV